MFSCPRWLRSQRALLRLMAVLCLLEIAGTAWAIHWATSCRRASQSRFAERLDPTKEESGLTQPITDEAAQNVQTTVTAGVYVDEIRSVSIRDLQCQIGFTIWFRWPVSSQLTPEDLRELSVLNGQIESLEVEEQLQLQGDHYLRCRVLTGLAVRWELDRFPLDHQQIVIAIEHPRRPRSELTYQADVQNSRMSSRAIVPLWQISDLRVFEKPHAWQTSRGDPRQFGPSGVNWSQLRAIISLSPRSWGYHLKLFQCTFIAVGVALAALLVPPHFVDPRFGLGVGGLFAAVANSWVTQELIPDTGTLTLADLINLISTLVILLTILISILSLHLHETFGQASLSRFLDKGCLLLLAPGYLFFQMLVAWFAAG